MMPEYNFYINLYDDFINTKNDEDQKILWKTHKILDLMRITSENDPTGFMENGLRMIMLLFNKYDITSCDLSGNDLLETFPDKKEEIKVILKTEFT